MLASMTPRLLDAVDRLVRPFTDLVRWGEPWDLEDDGEPAARAEPVPRSVR